MSARTRRDGWQADGSALVIVLLTTMLVAALAAAMVLVSDTETRIVASVARGEETREAAAVVVDRVIGVLDPAVDWSAALGGALTGPLDGSLLIMTPAGTTVDLDAARRDLQSETDAEASGSPNRPVWRLFASGPLAALMGFSTVETSAYGAAWIADDWREVDGDPSTDTNGIVILRAEAWGRAGAFRGVDVTLAHGDLQSGCTEPVGWTYDLGSDPRLGWHGYRTWSARLRPSRGPAFVPVGFRTLGPNDPCRTLGPGATIVTWREVR